MRTVLDLFCGAVGGWSAGVERAGWRTVAACEIDPWRRAVFGAQHPGVVLYADVRDVTATRLRADLGYLPDVVVGSPPCQDISAANSRGTGIGGARSGLFWEWLRVIDEVRPDWACAENSPRFRALGYDDIAAGLEAIGYACWPLVVGADDAGANHRRKRVWVVARNANAGSGAARIGPSEAPRRRSHETRRMEPHADPIGIRDDVDAHGRLSGGARRHADGCVVMGAGADGRSSADADGDGWRQRGWRRLGGSLSASPNAAAHTDGDRKPRRTSDGEMAERHHAPSSDLDCPGHPQRPRIPGDDGEELPPALRDIGRAWPDWNNGLAGLTSACAAAGSGPLDDGRLAGLPAGLRNRAIAALGDAVVPAITEAVARAIDRVDAELDAQAAA